MTDNAIAGYSGIDDGEYRRRIRAWTIYDWANSAFATTILAAVLPVYYSQVAGRSLGSAAQATAYWTATLSISSRPAVLGLIVFFVVGIVLLARVDEDQGRLAANEADAAAAAAGVIESG